MCWAPFVILCYRFNLCKSLIFRSLWEKEKDLSSEIGRLQSEVVKAEKSLDHATPGVSTPIMFEFCCATQKFVKFIDVLLSI